MKHTTHTSQTIPAKRPLLTRAGLVLVGIGLSACQQVIDRLEADLKGDKPTAQAIAPQQITLAKPSEPTPATPSVAATVREPAVSQAQKSTPAVSNKRAIANQVQTIDEDGNPLVETAGAKKTKPRVLIED